MSNDPDRAAIAPRARRVAGLLAAILAGGVLGCEPVEETTQRIVPRVKAFEVGEKTRGQVRTISGTIAASSRSPLSFGVDGTVDRVLVARGDAVEPGQLLATLDAEPLKLATDEARAQLAGARAKLVEAEQSHERAKQLLAAGSVSEADFEISTSNLRSARASLRGAQSRVEQAERNRRRAELRAPFRGRIAERSVDPFQEIDADDAAFVLQGGDLLKVKLQVPDALIRNVDYGQTVGVTFPTDAGVELSGVVSLIGAQADTGSGFEVEVRLPPSDADLRPGMSARVTFNFDDYLEGRDVYLVPLSAVAIDVALLREGSRGSRVAPIFVYDEEAGVVRVRDVRVLDLRGNQIEVYEGLSPGERGDQRRRALPAGRNGGRALVPRAGPRRWIGSPASPSRTRASRS